MHIVSICRHNKWKDKEGSHNFKVEISREIEPNALRAFDIYVTF